MRQKTPRTRFFNTFIYSDPRNILWICFLSIYWLKMPSLPKCQNRLAAVLSSLRGITEVVWEPFGQIICPKFRRYIIYKASKPLMKVCHKFVKNWSYFDGNLHIIGLKSFEIKRAIFLRDMDTDHNLINGFEGSAWCGPREKRFQ